MNKNPGEIFKLPQEITLSLEDGRVPIELTQAALSRLAIAGFVDTSPVRVHREAPGYGYGEPLILVDDEPYGDTDCGDDTNIAYYGLCFREPSKGFVLSGGKWEHIVSDFGDGSTPFVYYGSAVYPPTSTAFIFESAVNYDQASFEEAIRSALSPLS